MELWVTLKMESAGRVALVLDGSEDAQPHWPNLNRLVQDLLNALPRTLQPTIYFLGNPKPYAASEFVRDGGRWYQENNRRARLIGPVLEQLEDEPETTVVVLGTGRVFDAEDWPGTPPGERTLWVRFGEAALTGGLCREYEPSLEQLRLWLDNPVVRVELSGRGAMPFFWDNDDYRWDGARLAAERAERWSVQVGFLGATAEEPQAVATLANGKTRTVTVESCEPCVPTTDWQVLTPQEAETFRQCVRTGQYRCPICNCQHPASQLRCEEGGILGTPIYPSLAELRGFVLLRERSGEVQFCLHPCAALRVGGQAVAMRSGGQAEVYRLDAASEEWRRSEELLTPYHPIGEDTYALVL